MEVLQDAGSNPAASIFIGKIMNKYNNYKNTGPGFSKKEKYLYPSRHGSHSSMINEEKTAELIALYGHSKNVVLEDENGFYITEKRRIDTGLADPSRYSSRRR